MPVPELSVIIPTRNGEKSLPPLLASLRSQTLETGRYEVIVVDNASTDGTAEAARDGGALLVREPVPGRARARNAGARRARGRLYAFTDADCVVAADWLERLLGCSTRAPLVAGGIRLTVGERPNAVERFESLWRFGQEAWVSEQGWAATANLMVHDGAFRAIGGFDPGWRHVAEDVDFCIRAQQAGFALAYCGEAEVEHRPERDLLPMLRRCFLHGFSSNQAYYRIGLGFRAWRDPLPALTGERALRMFGARPEHMPTVERRIMLRLGRLAYAARVAGSLWAEVRRAR